MNTQDDNTDEPPAIEATNFKHQRGNRKFKIDRTLVASWAKKLADDDRALIFWLFDYAASRDLPNEEIGKRLKQPDGKPYSKDSVYQALTGRRTKDQLANFIAAIADLRKVESERSTITRLGFVETGITRRIFQVCDATRNFGKMGVLIGPTHIGKTAALMEYASRNNHGATPYVRMPAGGSRSAFLRLLARQLNVSTTGTDETVGSKIFGSFDERMLLVVDEFHQCIPRKVNYKRAGIRPSTYYTVEWLRELHDRTGTAILLSTTPLFDDAMEEESFSAVFKQTLQRALITCRLPDAPSRKDLDLFAKHFGMAPAKDEARDLQTMILKEDSLGRWISILEGASRIANKAGAAISWDYVIQSHAALVKLENGD